MAISLRSYSEHDQQIWDEELADFVPERVFDAHVHLLHRDHLSTSTPGSFQDWGTTDLATLKAWAERLYPGRETHFLVLGTPSPGIDVDAHNRWAIGQVQQDALSRMNRLVTPQCDVETIRRDIQEHGFVGLKPYRLFSITGEFAQCRIHEFLTHEQMELADELGLWVTMHLSRYHGCADEQNLNDLEEFTLRRYPRIKWILAHCARSFTYWPIRQAIERLRDLPNLWYDLSAVTDVRPFITLFSKENVRRIFYGSDGVDATYFHGQYCAFGRAWQGVDADKSDLRFPHCDGRPILAIYEQLLSMKHAAEIVGLSHSEIEDIFWRNAWREILGESSSHGVEKSQQLYRRAEEVIPGATQLISRRANQFAEGVSPSYAKRARGARFEDVDGNHYIDWASGIRSIILGWCDPVIDAAVKRQIDRGTMYTVNHELEIELADELIASVPCAEMVRYAKGGGEACAMAVRIARGVTGREKILFCGYHGWHDWYLSANHLVESSLNEHLFPGIEPIGVPRCLAGTALPFPYADSDALGELLDKHRGEVAAVIMEPYRSALPPPGYLESVRRLTQEHETLLIFDEVSTGMRLAVGGAQEALEVTPDLAVFAKSLSNGYPMAAVVGSREAMEPASRMFVSSTYWSDTLGIQAALTTMRELRRRDVPSHLKRVGEELQRRVNEIATETGAPVVCGGVSVTPPLTFTVGEPGLPTLYIQEMARRGCHGYPGFVPNAAHGRNEIEETLSAIRETFKILAHAVEKKCVGDLLECAPRRSIFRRLVD